MRALFAGFSDAVTSTTDPVAMAASGDLIVFGRTIWTKDDTEGCRDLHQQKILLPILAVSGPCEASERAGALRAGADDFLAMPFDAEELVARAFALVRRANSGARRVTVGPFLVDVGRREVHVDGLRIGLTLREYDLLSTLVERAGEVVTRRELASQVASGAESNAVDVHMSRIRDKLGTKAAAIETVRGLGYRLKRP